MAYYKKNWGKKPYQKKEITGSNKSFSDYREGFVFTQYHTEIEGSIKSGANTFIDAGPGSGKTSTIFAIVLPSLIESGLESGILFAFNKANANDFQSKIPAGHIEDIKSGTIHSILLGILKKSSDFGYVRINAPQEAGEKYGRYQHAKKGKTREIVENMFPEENANFWGNVCRLIGLAKNSAFGIKSCDGYSNPNIGDRDAWQNLIETYSISDSILSEFEGESDGPDLIESAQKAMIETIKAKSEIDFDDMLYFPLYYSDNCELPNIDFIVMDEGQDIFPITLEFIARMRQKGAQIVMVGDRKQAINGFAGSIAGAIDIAQQRLSGNILSMPISFRCSKIAAKKANEIFENSVIPSENALEGEEIRMDFTGFTEIVPEMDEKDVILSRTHKNLIPFAMQFIKQGQQFIYKGIRKWANEASRCIYHAAKISKDLNSVRQSLTEYVSELEDKYLGRPKMPKWVIEKRETIETLCVLIAGIEAEGGDFASLKNYLSKLIAADRESAGDCITLATIHASKGGEWENVYIVGDMISPLAKTENELYAEKCVSFVAVTRSKKNLIFVSAGK